jgi:hypothetical protein|tara:strand:- start:87 stop:419 length:333 start_codon:yes stop_codon:yes gene_type:complete
MKDNFDVHEWNRNRYLERIQEEDKNETKDKLEENLSPLSLLAKTLGSMNPELDFNISGDRINVVGSEQDKFNWGDDNHGKKFGEYEVFHIEDDDRGEIVRIVKSDSISRG